MSDFADNERLARYLEIHERGNLAWWRSGTWQARSETPDGTAVRVARERRISQQRIRAAKAAVEARIRLYQGTPPVPTD